MKTYLWHIPTIYASKYIILSSSLMLVNINHPWLTYVLYSGFRGFQELCLFKNLILSPYRQLLCLRQRRWTIGQAMSTQSARCLNLEYLLTASMLLMYSTLPSPNWRQLRFINSQILFPYSPLNSIGDMPWTSIIIWKWTYFFEFTLRCGCQS